MSRSVENRQGNGQCRQKELRVQRHVGMGKRWLLQQPVLSVRIKGKEIQTFIYSLDKYFLDTDVSGTRVW